MPAPAVYIIAVVGSVGVAIVFKEFVYPHLAPRIDRWKAEFQAARKRRTEALLEVALTDQGADKGGRRSDDSHSDHSGKGSSSLRPSVHPILKNGSLIRRRSGSSESTPGNLEDVELNWISSTTTATETGKQQQDLRLRKNIVSSNESSHDFELNKTTSTHAFLDESIQSIPYTPLSPVRTPTPTHVPHNSSSTHSPLETPFSTPSPDVALLSKSKTNDINSPNYPFIAPLQPPSSLPSPMANASSARNAESFPPSPPVIAPFLPAVVEGNALSSVPSQLLSPTWSHPSPYQSPPHVHAIPSLSQSYPLDDVLDYEHGGLELLSPPTPLSRTDSPFELTGLSPRPGMGDALTLLSVGGDRSSASPVDSTNSTRSSAYVSFSSPALSTSSRIPSENGYENDFSASETSSTFSSPFVSPTRLGDTGSESHDQARLGLSLPLPSSRSSQPFDIDHLRRERNTGWTSTSFSTVTTRSHESDARRSIISFNDNISDDYAETRTLRTRSPSMRTVTESVVTPSTSTDIHLLESAARLSRVTTSDSDFDTGSELSDLDFMSMSGGEYEAAALAPAAARGFVNLGSQSVVYPGMGNGSGEVGRAGGIGGPGIEDGNESDTSSWSLAGGSELEE